MSYTTSSQQKTIIILTSPTEKFEKPKIFRQITIFGVLNADFGFDGFVENDLYIGKKNYFVLTCFGGYTRTSQAESSSHNTTKTRFSHNVFNVFIYMMT